MVVAKNPCLPPPEGTKALPFTLRSKTSPNLHQAYESPHARTGILLHGRHSTPPPPPLGLEGVTGAESGRGEFGVWVAVDHGKAVEQQAGIDVHLRRCLRSSSN